MCKKCNPRPAPQRNDAAEVYIGPRQSTGSTALAVRMNIGTTQRPDLLWLPRSILRIDPETGGAYLKQWYIVRNGLSARIAPTATTTTNGAE